MNKKLVLIPGSTGKMGETFFQEFSNMKDYKVIGITSNKSKQKGNVRYSNLLIKKDIENFLSEINFSHFTEIFIIHSIGPFIFEDKGRPLEDKNKDGIDDKIYDLNFSTFKNFVEKILKKINKDSILTIVGFGSISDRYNIPWWQSYSKTKNILRKFMRNLINKRTRGVFINVGSTEKEEERPFAHKKYWLSCKEVVEKSIGSILNKDLFWQEIDIFKPSPEYYEGFFENHEDLRKRWIYDMYGK